MAETTPQADAEPATGLSHAPDGSSNAQPDYVLDALELPTRRRWTYTQPGDTLAGVLCAFDKLDVPKLNQPTETRTVPAVMIHGTAISEGETAGPYYYEVLGFSTVLERELHRLAHKENGTLVRLMYLGTFESQTAGFSDYKDFELTTSARTDTTVPDHVLVDTPELQDAIDFIPVAELDQGEPF